METPVEIYAKSRRFGVTVVALLLVLACLPALAHGAGTDEWHDYANAAGRRSYLLHVPPDLRAGAPLVVYLHGCTQSAQDVAVGTGWSRLADRDGILVAYPEQTATADTNRCWRWFDSASQHRDSGEPSLIAGITQEIVDARGVDPDRVYVIGASAGGYMSSIMGAAYPDLYAAIGIVGGGPYDLTGVLAYEEMGPRARTMPTFVLQGTLDLTNPILLADAAVGQWLSTSDLADDGALNFSISRLPATEEHHGGLLGTPEEYPYTVKHYVDGAGASLLDYHVIHGLGHAWPGGDPAGSFTDPRGPGATEAAASFLLAHAMP
jgi:poly(hydroxyalkanoate) depolymerase family esterase